MQKLQVELKDAPMDTSHVHCTVSQELNRDQSLSASGILACNNPEVNRTQQHTGERKAIVYVLSVEGLPLMPCNHAKSRHLLKSGKARIFKLFPFTIQLNFEVENVVQKVVMGVDTGYKIIAAIGGRIPYDPIELFFNKMCHAILWFNEIIK